MNRANPSKRLAAAQLGASVTAAMLALAGAASAQTAQPADLILTGGQIYTDNRTWSEAMAVSKGTIVAMGDARAVDAWRGPATRVIELKGDTVLPGFHDMHIHIQGAGSRYRECVLKREATPDEIRATVKGCVARAKPGEWITGGSWVNDVFKTEVQDRRILDEVSPANPVMLSDETGHSLWLNTAALKLAGITGDTKPALNGQIEKRPDGEPNGILREGMRQVVRPLVPPATEEQKMADIARAQQEMLSFGITAYRDAGNNDSIPATAALYDKGGLKLRANLCMRWFYNITGVDQAFEALYARRSLYNRGDRIRVDCIKLPLDGVPGEGHTAAMLEPYADAIPGDPDDSRKYGVLNAPPEVIKKMVTRFDADGMSVLMHCTGDRCARAAVDAIEAARLTNGYVGPLHQVGHSNFTTKQDLDKGKRLGATFEYSAYLYYWNGVTRVYHKAIGDARFVRYKPLRDTIDSGAIAIEGSDWPVSASVNPWIAAETLVTRERPGGGGEKLAPGQAITMKEVIDIYTVNGARQWGHSDRVGLLKPGMRADMIVLDRNPLTAPITTVHDTVVKMTFIDGEAVFTR